MKNKERELLVALTPEEKRAQKEARAAEMAAKRAAKKKAKGGGGGDAAAAAADARLEPAPVGGRRLSAVSARPGVSGGFVRAGGRAAGERFCVSGHRR